MSKANNLKIRVALLTHNMKMYELAIIMGVHENTLLRRMREELPEDEQNRIVKLIEGGDQ